MGGYVPPGMNPRRAGTIADLILRRGDIQARRAQTSGDIWGRALAGLGQQIGGAIQQHQERKEGGKRSEALMSLASSPVWGEDPREGFAQAVGILGPEGGAAFAKGIMATGEVAQQPDPGVAQKNLPVIAKGWLAGTPETRAGLYPILRQTLLGAQMGTEDDWPPEWSEDQLPQVEAMVSQYAPEEEAPGIGSDEWLMSASPEQIEQLKSQRETLEPPEAEEDPAASLARIERESAARARGTATGKPAKASPKLTPTQEANVINRLTKKWDDATKQTREIGRQARLMDAGIEAARRGDMAAGSQAVLVTFQKILDPTSVVRESEYARSASGQSLFARARGAVDKLTKGGAGVPLAELERFAKLAKDMVAASTGSHVAAVRKRLGRTADRYDIPHDVIFEDLEAGAGSGGVGPATHVWTPEGIKPAGGE